MASLIGIKSMRTTVIIEKRGKGYISTVRGQHGGGHQGARCGIEPHEAAASAAKLMLAYAGPNREGGDLMAPPEVLELVPEHLRSNPGGEGMKTPLSEDILSLLGKDSDANLAERAGCCVETVRRERLSRGIDAYREYTDWTADMDAMLGTDTDQAVAKRLGVNKAAVMARRRRLKIEAHSPKLGRRVAPVFLSDDASDGVSSLTAHVSAETRKKANQLRMPLAALFKKSGLPIRGEVAMWQVIEYAVSRLYAEMGMDVEKS
jgi:hypothetical protein